MARPQELRARRDAMDAEAHADRLRDVIWKLEKQLDEVGKMSTKRLERLRTINAVLKEKGIKKPYQDELVRKLNVIQAIVEQELADAK